jgi:hypothetical protein
VTQLGQRDPDRERRNHAALVRDARRRQALAEVERDEARQWSRVVAGCAAVVVLVAVAVAVLEVLSA